MERSNKDIYSVAMSLQDGCIVMVKNGRDIVGSMTRVQSEMFSHSVMDWQAMEPASVEAPKPALKLINGDG